MKLSRRELARPWRDVGLCVVDVETTGLDLAHDHVISLGMVDIDDGRQRNSTADYLQFRPPRESQVGAIRTHGLRGQDLADAPALADSAPRLRQRLAGRVIVAHAAWVERAFLGRALGGRLRRFGATYLDTAALARADGIAPSGGRFEPDLEGLAVALGVTVHTPHHALGDALTTAEVFLALVARLGRDHEPTVGDLLDLTARHQL